jgi:hypothetical protein
LEAEGLFGSSNGGIPQSFKPSGVIQGSILVPPKLDSINPNALMLRIDISFCVNLNNFFSSEKKLKNE